MLRGLLRALARLVGNRRAGSGSGAAALRDLEFVAIDLETTGLDPRTDVAVALAAIPFSGGRPRPEAGYTRLVNPGRPIPAASQAIHGIGDADVQDAPPVAEALAEFLRVCRGRPIVAHTAAFDLAIVNRAARGARLPALGGDVLDVGALAHGLYPSWWDLSLEGLGRLLEVEPVDRHTAPGDALTAGLIFVKMVPFLERHGILTLADAHRLQRRTVLLPGGPGATGGGLAGP
jgi:DNA polymerase III epsilon subunit-like protein